MLLRSGCDWGEQGYILFYTSSSICKDQPLGITKMSATLKRRWGCGEDDSSACWDDTWTQVTSLLVFFPIHSGFLLRLEAWCSLSDISRIPPNIPLGNCFPQLPMVMSTLDSLTTRTSVPNSVSLLHKTTAGLFFSQGFHFKFSLMLVLFNTQRFLDEP